MCDPDFKISHPTNTICRSTLHNPIDGHEQLAAGGSVSSQLLCAAQQHSRGNARCKGDAEGSGGARHGGER